MWLMGKMLNGGSCIQLYNTESKLSCIHYSGHKGMGFRVIGLSTNVQACQGSSSEKSKSRYEPLMSPRLGPKESS